MVTISVSVLPNRAKLRFMSFRTFSTFNIDQLALPSLKKVSVREIPVAARLLSQELGVKGRERETAMVKSRERRTGKAEGAHAGGVESKRLKREKGRYSRSQR